MLSSLESRIPPPFVALVTALVMGTTLGGDPRFEPGFTVNLIYTVLMNLSWVIAGAALLVMWRARTTINPMHPERSSALVTTGIYAWSRNPMYVSLLCLLMGYSLQLGHVAAVLGPILFVSYVTRFHIVPEERALEARFGDAYRAYKARVRRWI
ncbi:methyltransferase family protein [Nitrogeniibacter aestuarii]|uniref:methyltransferase family protein n=1 Tax=Nitrogeniibacter aestuarii TaxID=2815343 RepID=UPI001D124675|nr:isoprenylcysteine carboxylmethyltransferase family protein [Nitrogeniibacter aestuarii]